MRLTNDNPLAALSAADSGRAITHPQSPSVLSSAGGKTDLLRKDKLLNRAGREPLPHVSGSLLRLFTWYSRRFIRKNFHSLRISRVGAPPEIGNSPLVVFSNHASWWDPLVGLILRAEFFPDRTAYAPIDSEMLRRYGFFRRLGFFGVEPATRRGAVQFLRTAEAVLADPQNILTVTPQGRFVDVRDRPIRFASGLGHLAARTKNAAFVPLAIEYAFWEERLPEVLVRFGAPVEVCRSEPDSKDAYHSTGAFERALEETQEALSVEARSRRPDDFVTLLRGAGGQAVVYDLWRCIKAWWSGEPFKKEHGLK